MKLWEAGDGGGELESGYFQGCSKQPSAGGWSTAALLRATGQRPPPSARALGPQGS